MQYLTGGKLSGVYRSTYGVRRRKTIIITNNKKQKQNRNLTAASPLMGFLGRKRRRTNTEGVSRFERVERRREDPIVEQRIYCVPKYGRRGWLTNERKRKNDDNDDDDNNDEAEEEDEDDRGGGGGVGDYRRRQ